jgi:hypothetical protein
MWMAFWGAVALDSALTYRRSLEAVERAVDADPVLEIYEGPPEQPAQVQRWLLWREPTLARLRELSRRARQMSRIAPVIAVVGPILLLTVGRRRGRDA